MNYQLLENGTFDYVHVGNWTDGKLTFHDEIKFGTQKKPTSVCSLPCAPGYYKVLKLFK